MRAVLAALALLPLASPSDRLVEIERRGVELKTDLGDEDREHVLELTRLTIEEARHTLMSLDLRQKSDQEVHLRVYADFADYQDWRRRTLDQSTMISSLSHYNPTRQEAVLAWENGIPDARAQLRRQVARHVLLQFAKNPPNFFEEGFAGLFEGFEPDGFGDVIDLVDRGHLRTIRDALQRSEAAPLDELMDMQDVQFYGLAGAKNVPWSRTLLYAQSWSLVFYLLHAEDPAADSFRKELAARLETGRWNQSRFRRLLEEVAPSWRAFLMQDDLTVVGDLVQDAWRALADDRPEVARMKASAALGHDEDHRSARRVLAKAAAAEGDLDTAADAFLRLANDREDDLDALLGLTEVRLRSAAALQSETAARAAIEAGRRAAEAAPPGRRHLGLQLAADAAEVIGDVDEALKLVREAMRQPGTPRDALTALQEREHLLVKRAIGR